VVLGLVALPLAAFGGVYFWAAAPVVAGAILLALIVKPRFDSSTLLLDGALAAALAACAIQLVPVPTGIMAAALPPRLALRDQLNLGPPSAWVTLSIDRWDSVHASLVFLAALLTFVSCRTLFARRGVREVCRGIVWLGMALACFSIVQRGLYNGRIYGFWVPQQSGAFPFGPFINRNHCATWLIMAAALCFGYLIARLQRTGGQDPLRGHALRAAPDSRTLWLATAGMTMVLAIGLSLSRSGMGGFAIAVLVMVLFGRRNVGGGRRILIAGIAALVAATLILFGDVGRIVDRFSGQMLAGEYGRLNIWRDTVPLLRDFWIAGTGTGTYQTAMLFYQSTGRAYYFNNAHNHFVQLAAEGGLLLAVPIAIALASFVTTAWRRLHSDLSGVFWIRAGAAAGLVGLAVQSLWETGLRLPANAELAAVLGALVVHTPDVPARTRPGDGRPPEPPHAVTRGGPMPRSGLRQGFGEVRRSACGAKAAAPEGARVARSVAGEPNARPIDVPARHRRSLG
jgi:O-antigen ligase